LKESLKLGNFLSMELDFWKKSGGNLVLLTMIIFFLAFGWL